MMTEMQFLDLLKDAKFTQKIKSPPSKALLESYDVL